jgi:hypothetical protein
MGFTLDDPIADLDLRCEWESDGSLVLAGEAVNDLTPQESRQLEAYLRAFVRSRVEEIRARRIERLAALG